MDTLRILLVDDHEVVRLGLRSLLERQPGFNVVAEAATESEAVAMALQHKPDVVLMDIRLAGGDGVAACEAIMKQLPETKVIMLTSYADDDLLFAAIRAGAVGYVLKQVDGREVIRAVEAVGHGDAVLDPSLTQRVFQQMRRSIRSDEESVFDELTDAERQVLVLIAEGKTNREIGAVMYLSEGTVRNYVSSVFSKLGVSNRAEAAAFAIRHHLDDKR